MNSLDSLFSPNQNPVPPAGLAVLGATGDMVSKRESREALAFLAGHQILRRPEHTLTLAAGSKPVAGLDYCRRFEKGDRHSKPLDPLWIRRFEVLAGLERAGARLPAVDVSKVGDLRQLRPRLARNALYVALPPKLYEPLLKGLPRAGLLDAAGGFQQILLEKPFAADLAGARRLAELVRKLPGQPQVLLIDHFLAYPGTLSMLALRARPEVDEALNRGYLESVDLILSERIQSNDRPYFRETGCVIDMIQSHALLLLASFALELPIQWTGGGLQAARLKVLQSLDLHLESATWGQFQGFNENAHGAPPGAPPSRAETFVSVDFRILTPRWNYVPCRLSNAKGVSEDFFGLVIGFRKLPTNLAGRLGLETARATLLKINVHSGDICWVQGSRQVDEITPADILQRPPHALLLPQALCGQDSLFVSVAEALIGWQVADRLLKALRLRRLQSYPIGAQLEHLRPPLALAGRP